MLKPAIFAVITSLVLCCGLLTMTARSAYGAVDASPKSTLTNWQGFARQLLFSPFDRPIQQTQQVIQQVAINLRPHVVKHVLAVMQCVHKKKIDHNRILTIIDFSLPSNKKRLWTIDLYNKKLLYHTYVSHGIKSGELVSNQFSNKVNSKASSIGVYLTENSYYGRYGIALKMQGLSPGFNSNAYRRFIVMHGAWYMSDRFISRYGRSGRSWGCPALPQHLAKPIIRAISYNSLLVVYYPSASWLSRSSFLHCPTLLTKTDTKIANIPLPKAEELRTRKHVLFADINKNNKREENEPVVTLHAGQYQQFFKKPAPLKRMLRRQIKGEEYVVLTRHELQSIVSRKQVLDSNKLNEIPKVYYVIPVVKMKRGYYATEMKVISLGKIKGYNFKPNTKNPTSHSDCLVLFHNKSPVPLVETKHFIRWLGL